MENDPLARAFRQVSAKAWKLAYALTFRVADAEDLLQQSLMIAARKRHRIPGDDPWPWFAAVIHNEARNLRRKRARQSALALEEATMATNPDALPPEQAARAESLRRLRDAMRELPRDQRDALAAGYIGGLTQRQAAKALGMPLGTYKKRVRDGLAELRHRLNVDEKHAQTMLPLIPVPALKPGWESVLLQTIPGYAAKGALIGGITMKKFAFAAAGLLAVALTGFWIVPKVFAPENADLVPGAPNDAPIAAEFLDEPVNGSTPSGREASPSQTETPRGSATDDKGTSRPDTTGTEAADNDAVKGDTPAESTGRVAGRVVNSRGEGIADATVTSGAVTVITGKGGLFEITPTWRDAENLAVRLTASAEGFSSATSRELMLAPGGAISNLVLILHEGASVFGRVIWEGSDEPAVGVEVDATHGDRSGVEGDADLNFAARSTTSDSNGAFMLDGLAPGEWFIRAMNAPTQMRVLLREDGPRPPRQSDSKFIKLNEGEEKGPLSLELPRQMKLRWTLAAPAEGRVFVQLLESGRNQLPSYGGWGVGLNPDDDGVYEVDWLAADHRQLRIKADGFAETAFNIIPRDGEDLDLGRLTLDRGVTLTGRVEDDSGRAIEGASVFIRSSIDMPFVSNDGRDPRAKLASATTDRSGYFEMSALSAGGFEIVAEHAEYARVTAKVGIRKDEDPQPVILVMKQAGTIFGIVFKPREPIAKQWPDVDGVRAISMDETRLVELVSLKPDYAGFLGKKGPYFAEFDENGGYEMAGLPPGEWFVVAYRDGNVDFRINVVIEPGRRTRADFDFTQRTGSIEGRVVRDGATAAETDLLLVGRNGRITRATPRLSTDQEGAYRFEDILPGTWFVLTPDEAALMDARVLTQRTVIVKPGETSNLDIDLEQLGATLQGFVTLDGLPFYNQLRLVPGFAGTSERHVRVGKDGSFSGTGLEPGSWHAWFRGGSGSALGVAYAAIEIGPENEPWRVDFKPVPISVTCGLELPERQRVNVVLVSDSPETDADEFSLAMGGTGPFLFSKLVAARYRFTLAVPGFAPVVREFDPTTAPELDLTPTAEGAVLTVKFKNAEGFDEGALKAWQYGQVWIEQKGYTSDKRKVAIRENYSAQIKFESLRPGSATIQFRGDVFEPLTVQVSVQPGEPTELEITPRKGARLLLKAAGAIELPQVRVTDARDQAVELSSGVLADARALAAGELLIGPLKAGSYKVVISKNETTAVVEFTVTRGQELELPMPALE